MNTLAGEKDRVREGVLLGPRKAFPSYAFFAALVAAALAGTARCAAVFDVRAVTPLFSNNSMQ